MLAAAVVGSGALLRRRYLRWGATDIDLELPLPGDHLLPCNGSMTAGLTTTRAITIAAAATDVWPWIAQLGQNRGGFYSYDRLENLVGCDIHSVDRIHSEWQHVSLGSPVNLAPGLALTVALIEPGTALVLRGAIPIGASAAPYDFTWAFVIRPVSNGTSRLLVRERYQYLSPWAPLIVQPAELVSCLMSPRMLRGIRERAERTPSHLSLDLRGRVASTTGSLSMQH